VTESKLDQKNSEIEGLQDNLRQSIMRLDETNSRVTSQEEELKKLKQTLEIEKMKKAEAINKLTVVMYERPPTKSGRSSEPRRQDREIRKLRGELQHEAEKFQNMVRKYQKELEDVQSKILEEQELRQDLQVKLLQSEQQLRQLKQTLGQPLNINGPGTPEIDGSEFSPILERDTCQLQIPKGHNPRKQGWKDVFMVMSFTTKKMLIYEREEDLETGAPISTLEFRYAVSYHGN